MVIDPLPAIYEKLRQEQSFITGKKFAVFDFDNTCIYNDVGEATLAYVCEQGLLRNKTLLSRTRTIDRNYHKAVFQKYHALLDHGRIQEAYEFVARILAGYSTQEINDLADKVITYEGKKLGQRALFGTLIARGVRVKQNTKELMEHLRNVGVEVWIVSASPKPIVERALYLFFKGHDCHCIAIETTVQHGIFTNQLIRPTPIYAGKLHCIQKFIHKTTRPLVGVGDSDNDLPMLEYSLMKVVSDRGNDLAALARKRGWYLI